MTAHTACLLLLVCLGVARADVGFERRSLKGVEDTSPIYGSLLNQIKDPVGGGFKIIGGASMVKPCCVSWGPGRIDCFTRTKTGSVGHWAKQDGVAKEWEDLGGIIVNNIECVSRQTGLIDVLVTGQNYALYVKSYTAATGKWTRWISKGQRLMETPSCVVRTPTAIDCMVRDGANKAVYIDSVNGKWTGWGSRGGLLSYPSKTSRRSPTITDYWHVGSNSNLWQTYRVNGKWGRWSNLGERLRGQPEVKAMNAKRIDILVPSTRTQLMHLVWNGSWQKWANLGGSIVDAPSCVVIGTSLHCFMVGSDSYLYRRSLEGGKWTGWLCSYGTFVEGPSCVLSDPAKKEISCYLRGFDRAIVEKVYMM